MKNLPPIPTGRNVHLEPGPQSPTLNPDDEEVWRRGLLNSRKQKEDYFLNGHDSPLKRDGKSNDGPLNYFEPDPSYRFEVALNRHSDPGSIIMATSKGTRRLFNNIGYFEVDIGGQPVRIQAYQSAERDDPSVFIPFRDATSGGETYGAARYIDLEVEHDDRYALDFNYAYNPYCAYSDSYTCPLPPSENWLKVPIRAGEKKYHEE